MRSDTALILKRLVSIVLFIVALSAVPVLSGCRGRTVLDSKTGSEANTAKQNKKEVVGTVVHPLPITTPPPSGDVLGKNETAIWFTQAAGDKLTYVSETRECPARLENANQALTFALNELFAGPHEGQGLASEVPAGTTLLKIDDNGSDGVTIDLSRAFVQGGGTDTFEVRLEQLRRTVSGIVKERPVFLNIEGVRLEASGDGLEVKQPINSSAP